MGPRLRIVSGKGGVGKSVVATALALAELSAGRRTLLCELRGHDRVASLLGVSPPGSAIREVEEGLFLVDINPEDAIHEYALMTIHFETIYRAVFENRLVKSFLRLVPSLAELVMLGKIWYHEQEQTRGRPRFDVIIIDAPATGHALALLRTPQAIEATVPAGPLREHARNIRALLTDPAKTNLHVVMTPEEMPVNEAVELAGTARSQYGIPLGAAVINQCVDPLPEGTLDKLAPLRAEPDLAAVPLTLELREDRRRAGEQHLGRLPAWLRDGAITLPRLVTAQFGRDELRTLAAFLQALVDA